MIAAPPDWPALFLGEPRVQSYYPRFPARGKGSRGETVAGTKKSAREDCSLALRIVIRAIFATFVTHGVKELTSVLARVTRAAKVAGVMEVVRKWTERIIPFDIVPRILRTAEWDELERGLSQRIAAHGFP